MSTALARLGLTRIDDPWCDSTGIDPLLWDDLQAVVTRVYVKGLAIQSDFARRNSAVLAAAASLGLITTVAEGHFTHRWRPTVKGLRFVQENRL